MELSGRDNFEQEKGNDNLASYKTASVPSDWRFGGSGTLTNTPTASVPTSNHLEACKAGLMESSPCSSGPMVESFCPAIWDHPTNSQNLGFCDINLQNSGSPSNTLGIRKGPLGPFGTERTVDMGWTPPNSIAKPAMFLPTASGIIPPGLSHFPADSGFIERAARFSCFSAGTFGDTMNPFGISESVNPYVRAAAIMQQPEEMFSGRVAKSVSGGQSQKNEVSMTEASKNVSLSVEQCTAEGSLPKKERKTKSCARSRHEVRQGVAVSGNDSDEAEFSGTAGQEEPSMLGGGTDEPSSSKGLESKKRRRSDQDNQRDQVKEDVQTPGETAKVNTEIQQKGDPVPTLTPNKSGNKHGKQGSQASDSTKEEYIHVRARRGQATNSHSLAERIRREKISERMKFLQDLVPGCSKVTGKAVMLDEIINYVQSLQRQVEFLSMKLATVNPCLDFNLEGLLAKDILQPRAVSLSMLGYSPDLTMPFPPLRPPQPGMLQTVLPGMANHSDILHQSGNTELTAMSRGYKEPSQVPNIWGEDELHNVVQMGFNSSAPVDNQGLNGSLPPSHMKTEP